AGGGAGHDGGVRRHALAGAASELQQAGQRGLARPVSRLGVRNRLRRTARGWCGNDRDLGRGLRDRRNRTAVLRPPDRCSDWSYVRGPQGPVVAAGSGGPRCWGPGGVASAALPGVGRGGAGRRLGRAEDEVRRGVALLEIVVLVVVVAWIA